MRTPLLPLLALGPLMAGAPSSHRAARATAPLHLDGKLDEADWGRAPVLGGLTQYTPLLGQPSRRSTEVRFLVDDRHLYVGARMAHTPGKADVVRQVHRRDQSSASDWFALFVDSAHDHRTAFSFMVNASNVQRDGVHFEDGTEDWSWDGVWASAVSVDADGWTAELKVPLSLLRLHLKDGAPTWGVNVGRRDEGSVREVSYWYAPPRAEQAWVSGFHHLEGLEGLQPQPRREWTPYVSAQRTLERAQPGTGRTWEGRAGLDARFGINGYSMLDLAVRPDFGQVEVDQAVLNLTTVETFLPEKRPFFLEGMELFQLPGPKLFYSRRIGRGLDASGLEDAPKAQEIAGAAKYTAKTPGGFSVGVLGAGLEAARGTAPEGLRQELAPATSAAVMRATQSLDAKGSYVGAFGSFLNQAGPGGRRASVAALDGGWASADRSLRIEGILAHSAAGPKGDPRQGSLARVQMKGAWGKGWTLDANAFSIGRAFDPNDLGYLDRPDRKGFTFDLDRRWEGQHGVLRNPMLRLNYCEFRDQAGMPFLRYGESFVRTEFASEYVVHVGGGGQADTWDDRELRTFDQPAKKYLRLPPAQWAFVAVDTPPNAAWAASVSLAHIWREGGPKREFRVQQTFKPTPRAEIQLETGLLRSEGEWHWMETQGGTPLVGMRRLTQFDQVLRLAYAFSPTMTVQVFSQWLAASWAFRDPHRWLDERTLAPGATPTVAPAASDRLWNLNLIARWEMRPGSSAFLVYTRGTWTDALASDRGSLSPRRDLALLQHLPADSSVQLKLSWLFR